MRSTPRHSVKRLPVQYRVRSSQDVRAAGVADNSSGTRGFIKARTAKPARSAACWPNLASSFHKDFPTIVLDWGRIPMLLPDNYTAVSAVYCSDSPRIWKNSTARSKSCNSRFDSGTSIARPAVIRNSGDRPQLQQARLWPRLEMPAALRKARSSLPRQYWSPSSIPAAASLFCWALLNGELLPAYVVRSLGLRSHSTCRAQGRERCQLAGTLAWPTNQERSGSRPGQQEYAHGFGTADAWGKAVPFSLRNRNAAGVISTAGPLVKLKVRENRQGSFHRLPRLSGYDGKRGQTVTGKPCVQQSGLAPYN